MEPTSSRSSSVPASGGRVPGGRPTSRPSPRHARGRRARRSDRRCGGARPRGASSLAERAHATPRTRRPPCRVRGRAPPRLPPSRGERGPGPAGPACRSARGGLRVGATDRGPRTHGVLRPARAPVRPRHEQAGRIPRLHGLLRDQLRGRSKSKSRLARSRRPDVSEMCQSPTGALARHIVIGLPAHKNP